MNNDSVFAQYDKMPPEQYEEYVLCTFINDQKFFESVKDVFCVNAVTGRSMNEFSDKTHYAIYRAILTWYNMHEGSLEAQMEKKDIIEVFDILSLDTNPVIVSAQYEFAAKKYLHIKQDISVPVAVNFVKQTFTAWWESAKQKAIIEKYSRYSAKDAAALLDELSSNVSAIKTSTNEDTFKDFDIIVDEEDNVKRLMLGTDFRNLSKCLGGGLGRREHAIMVAPTGAGKTVLACQLASSIADMGSKVLYITTEQPVVELLPRIISCWSFKEPGRSDPTTPPRIAFNLIKDGFSRKVLDALTPEQKDLLKRFPTKFANLHFEEWIGTSKDAKNSLRDSIKRYIDKYGGCDCVILDWIGAKLGYGMDPTRKRQEFYDAAQTMKELAYEFDMATLSTAQATADAVGKKLITERDIATCKNLHEQAAVGFGISALRTKDDGSDTADTKESYSKEQYVYCFKARKSVGLSWKLIRNFAYQRFDNF